MGTVSVKVSELSGAALDWAVAQSVGEDLFTCSAGTLRHGGQARPWQPSTDWSQGGPLIESNELQVAPMNGRKSPRWIAMQQDIDAFGQTPLIAACRAIVAAKLGETVDVPEVLL